jgi:hypothetical protein
VIGRRAFVAGVAALVAAPRVVEAQPVSIFVTRSPLCRLPMDGSGMDAMRRFLPRSVSAALGRRYDDIGEADADRKPVPHGPGSLFKKSVHFRRGRQVLEDQSRAR